MSSVNKVILLGYLGKDPEVRYSSSGMAVANFSLATSSGGGRDREQKTEWHRIVVFDKQAEMCNQYLSKGRQVYLEGRIQTRQWEKDGQRHSMTEIIAHQIVFLGSGSAEKTEPKRSTRAQASRTHVEYDDYEMPAGHHQLDTSGAGGDDDIPF